MRTTDLLITSQLIYGWSTAELLSACERLRAPSARKRSPLGADLARTKPMAHTKQRIARFGRIWLSVSPNLSPRLVYRVGDSWARCSAEFIHHCQSSEVLAGVRELQEKVGTAARPCDKAKSSEGASRASTTRQTCS